MTRAAQLRALTSLVLVGAAISREAGLGEEQPAWSAPQGGLAGRLRLGSTALDPEGLATLVLELKNTGTIGPLAVQAHNPGVFDAKVSDAHGRELSPTSVIIDYTFSPEWGVVPRSACLGFPVGFFRPAEEESTRLEIGYEIWILKPGKYRIAGRVTSRAFTESPGRPKPGNAWSGELDVPPLEVEIPRKSASP